MSIPLVVNTGDAIEDNGRRGLLLTVLGLIIISPDSLIIRLLSLDMWTILAFRGPLTAIGLLSIVVYRYRRDWWRQTKSLGRAGLAIVFLATVGSTLFVFAINRTSVSSVLVILAGAPVVAALLGRLFLGERLPRKTWLAIALVVSGVVLIVEPGQSRHLLGDLGAIGAMLALASTIIMTRRSRSIDMAPALIGSQAITGIVAIPFASYSSIDGEAALLFVLSGLVLLPIGNALFIAGPRYLPAAEVSLLLPIETVGGTLIVWGVLGEAPRLRTSIAAIIIIGTIAVHSSFLLRKTSALRPAR